METYINVGRKGRRDVLSATAATGSAAAATRASTATSGARPSAELASSSVHVATNHDNL